MSKYLRARLSKSKEGIPGLREIHSGEWYPLLVMAWDLYWKTEEEQTGFSGSEAKPAVPTVGETYQR